MRVGGVTGAGRIIAIALLAAGIVGLFAGGAVAADPKKYASIVVDAHSGRVLYARNADDSRYPASTTKIMTLYMLFEALDRGRLTLNDRFRVSQRAASQPPSKLGLKVGQTIRVQDAMFALVTKSANDVATVVAEGLAKTESNFARKMTAKARKLGMSRTTFRNASGLPDPRQVTTARDMARLGQAILHHYPRYYQHFSTRQFTYSGVTYGNHNRLLGSYEGMDGIKTGYIRASGYNLVASAKRGNQRLIGVVFGGESSKSRNQEMASLLDDAFVKHGRILEAQAERRGQTVAEIGDPSPRPGDSAVVGLGAPAEPTASLAASAGGWGIQVGAFREQRSASDAARTAFVNASEFVRLGKVAIVQYADADRNPFYLARIHDLQKQQADQACQKLARVGTECFQLQVVPQAPPEQAPRDQSVGLAPQPSTVARGTPDEWGVQVGAYPQHAAAYKVAQQAVRIAPRSLNEGVIKVIPVKSGQNRPLYRGRVVGISKNEAERACRQLKARRMACMVLRPDFG